MALEFKLPDIGEGVAEGEIVKWLVSVGDTVTEHQPVVEVMTDKATVEIPAPAAGTISKLSAEEGQVVPVGTVIFHLDAAGAGEASAGSASAAAPAAPKAAPAAAAAAASAASSGGGAAIDFKLPDVGEGVAEGEIVKWLVEAGADVAEHQAVVEVMTDKATVEIPAPAAGRIAELRAKEGEVVPVGQVIFVLETAAAPAAASSAPAARPAAKPEPAMAGVAAAPAASAAAAPVRTNGKVLAVPSARRVARELGIDLSRVAGTGRNGVVRRADVEAFAASGTAAAPAAAAAPTPSAAPAAADSRTPFRGVRRKIAEAMTRSKHTAAHFTVVEELDVTDLVTLREQAKSMAGELGVKLTYMPFIMKAVAASLVKFPQLNSMLDEDAQEIVTFGAVNLGIAADTDNGLIVPVIRDVHAKGMTQLGLELKDLAERTRSGKVRSEELKGSTFTITNAGNIGGILATPVINFPEVAILGVHRIVKRPGVVETPEGDRIEVRKYMNLSISVDHRIVDGADAARFLVHMKRLLENPGLLAL